LAQKVYFHLGLPKTGTTYLQSVLWANKAHLLDQGILLPGESARTHMQASVVVREHPGLPNRAPEVRDSWDRVVAEVNAWPGTALISHEFFGAASQEQARRALDRLAPAEVHLIITARDVLTVLTSYWQEFVKHGFLSGLDDFPPAHETYDEWSWATVDLRSVVERWGAGLDPARVHILVLPPPDVPRETLLHEFCALVGIDPTPLDIERAREYRSLGVVEAELLRRTSPHLTAFTPARDRGVWIRSYLAQGKLVPREGERFLPSAERIGELRERARDCVEFLGGSGVDVVGELDRLLVPEELPERRHPSSVTDTELLDSAILTIVDLMVDVRALREANTELRAAAEEQARLSAQPEARVSFPRRVVRGLRRRLLGTATSEPMA
jgi:hypothetical protein